jgi:hypothetical protein
MTRTRTQWRPNSTKKIRQDPQQCFFNLRYVCPPIKIILFICHYLIIRLVISPVTLSWVHLCVAEPHYFDAVSGKKFFWCGSDSNHTINKDNLVKTRTVNIRAMVIFSPNFFGDKAASRCGLYLKKFFFFNVFICFLFN